MPARKASKTEGGSAPAQTEAGQRRQAHLCARSAQADIVQAAAAAVVHLVRKRVRAASRAPSPAAAPGSGLPGGGYLCVPVMPLQQRRRSSRCASCRAGMRCSHAAAADIVGAARLSEAEAAVISAFLLSEAPLGVIPLGFALQGQLDQAIHQRRIGQPTVLPQFGIHADLGETRDGVQLAQVQLIRTPALSSSRKSTRAMPAQSIAR